MEKREGIVIHCSDSTFGSASLIRKWHTEAPRNWSDIGYHFVINNGMIEKGTEIKAMDGAVELGRELGKTGAHAKGYNHYIGICLIGVNKFTDNQMHSLVMLLKELVDKYDIDPQNILGHYEVSDKPCPNFNVRQLIANVFPKEG